MNHPHAERPLIGDELLRERLNGAEPTPDGPYAHWFPGQVPDRLAGTEFPGDVHLHLEQLVGPWVHEPAEVLDLSWTPPDVDAILDEMLGRLDMLPAPDPSPVQVMVSHWDHQAGRFVDGWPADPDSTSHDWPTQELKAITEEER